MDSSDASPEKAREAVEAAHKAIGIDPATGFATDGDWPLNHRLRAEAMAAAGVTTDPDGHVADDMIAATKERVEAEKAAAEKAAEAAKPDDAAKPKPSVEWSRDKLVEAAHDLGVDVEADDNEAAIVAKIEAAAHAAGQEG